METTGYTQLTSPEVTIRCNACYYASAQCERCAEEEREVNVPLHQSGEPTVGSEAHILALPGATPGPGTNLPATCKHCGLAVTSEPYGGNRWWQPEWCSDDEEGFHCRENDGDKHEVSYSPVLDRVESQIHENYATFDRLAPALCPTCFRSHCSCSDFPTPSPVADPGTPAPTATVAAPEPQATPAADREAPVTVGAVSFQHDGRSLLVTFPCEDCSRSGYDYVDTEHGESVEIECPTCSGKAVVTLNTDAPEFDRLWTSFKDRELNALTLERLLDDHESLVNDAHVKSWERAPFECSAKCGQRFHVDRLPVGMKCWACGSAVVERKERAA